MEQVWASPGPIGRRIAHELVRRPFFWADDGSKRRHPKAQTFASAANVPQCLAREQEIIRCVTPADFSRPVRSD